MKNLKDKKIAILATDGFEESELIEPLNRFKEEGATVHVVSPEGGSIRGWKGTNWAKEMKVDKTLNDVKPSDYDGLMLPGGVINPDLLRKNKKAIEFVKGFKTSEKMKPIAAICHGPWMLAEAGIAKGRKLTSYDSIRTDMVNAGATWMDKEVVVDNGVVTSRSPEDLMAFMDKAVEEFKEGKHTR